MSIYVHFDSKSSLITAVVEEYVKDLDLDYKSYIESFPDSTPMSDILFSFAREIADILADKVGYYLMKVVYEAQLTRTVNPDPIMGYHRDLYKLFAGIIDKGIQEGEFKKELNVETVTKYCIMTIRGAVYEWCVRYPDYDLREEILEYFKILFTGVKNNN